MILLSLVLSGTGTHWLGSRKFTEGPGGLTVTHFGQRHDIVTRRMDIVNFYIDPARLAMDPLGAGLDSVLSGWLPLEPALCRAEDDVARIDLSGRPLAGQLAMSMCLEVSRRDRGWETSLMAQFRAFLVECCREAIATGIMRRSGESAATIPRRPGNLIRGHEGIARVRRQLDEKYAETHSLDSLAALAGLDKSYLCRAFRKATGRTLTEYLLERRLRAAVGLLRSGSRRVTEVALSVGFNDPVYFTRVFTRRIGVNPRRYGVR